MRLLLLPFLAGCLGSGDVTGPFTGPVTRFAIDRYDLPLTRAEAEAFGDDLDGNGTIDNQIGLTFAALDGDHNLTTFATSMAAVGLLPSTIEIQADSLDSDQSVGVSYIGRPGDTAVPASGRFVDGNFWSNRAATTADPAEGTLVLPVFIDADPTSFVLNRGEIELTRDGTGYTGVIRGQVDGQAALTAAAASLQQMVMGNPHDHAELGRILDANNDSIVTLDEIVTNDLVKALLAPDLMNSNGVSIGFGFHISVCPSGACAPTAIADTCHDRVLDGDEVDVDCGGSCHTCGIDAKCVVASDCQSNGCDNGTCRAPTCTDEVQDGFETGVDCGTNTCGNCSGNPCTQDQDCHSGHCDVDRCQ